MFSHNTYVFQTNCSRQLSDINISQGNGRGDAFNMIDLLLLLYCKHTAECAFERILKLVNIWRSDEQRIVAAFFTHGVGLHM